jgi:hypothetical protein
MEKSRKKLGRLALVSVGCLVLALTACTTSSSKVETPEIKEETPKPPETSEPEETSKPPETPEPKETVEPIRREVIFWKSLGEDLAYELKYVTLEWRGTGDDRRLTMKCYYTDETEGTIALIGGPPWDFSLTGKSSAEISENAMWPREPDGMPVFDILSPINIEGNHLIARNPTISDEPLIDIELDGPFLQD